MKTPLILITLSFVLLSNALAQPRFLSIELDKQLGANAEREILADPKTYPILPRKGNKALYDYLENIRDNILNTGKVVYAKDFVWKLQVINDPKTINAFVTPGGYIYVYTGLIAYLDNEAQLAGVIAHEIAHADRRHSVQQIGRDAVVRLLRSRRNQDRPVLGELLSLRYGRGRESDADEYSVIYICATDYHAPSITDFFEKIAEGGSQSPQFLSTHPNEENRVEAMNVKIQEIGYSGTVINKSGHQKIKAALPKASRSRIDSSRRLPSRLERRRYRR